MRQKYYILMNENGKMKPIDAIPKRRGGSIKKF
jgi:hypothetical protein